MMDELNRLSKEIVDAAFQVHTHIGAGVFESIYEKALAHELFLRGINFTTQVGIPAIYKGQDLGLGFRADMIVEDKIIIEIKSVERLAPVHAKQLMTYLKLTDKKLGLLINFNTALIKDGIRRIIM